jgi:DNA replication protein DnaD
MEPRSGRTVHAEDERLVTAVLALLGRELLPLTNVEITQWIEGFSDWVLIVNATPEKHIIRANVKNFLQSLYSGCTGNS